ncbi:MAG TPA: restriction endonuclease subunit S [Candidatus Paceibacterota bacterium]|nr:restriction endonuclease subunit S [Candidatus Paceibacterota bacterium]
MKQELIQKQKLPEGWKWSNLKEISINPELGLSDGNWVLSSDMSSKKEVRLIQLADIGINEFLNVSDRHITKKRAEEIHARWIDAGDILIARMPDPIGRACIVPELGIPLITAVDVSILKLNKNVADSSFISYYLNSPIFMNKSISLSSGSTRKRVTRKKLELIKILLPPLSVQRNIVAKINQQISQIEIMKKESKKEKESIEEMMNSYLKKIFEIPEIVNSKKIKLLTLTNKIGSGSTPRGGYRIYKTQGIPFIRSMNVYMNSFDRDGLSFIDAEINQIMKNTKVEKKDVLLNITGASIGRVCVVPDDICPANVNQHVSIIRCKQDLNPYYLAYFISQKEFQKNILNIQSGATRQALTKSQIENFDIPLPDIKIQNKMVDTLKLIEKEINIQINFIDRKILAISQLQSSILNEVFGKYEIENDQK